MNRIGTVGIAGLGLLIALTACSKSSDNSSSSTSTEASAAASPMGEATAAAGGAMAGANANDGAKVYQTNCSSCHQASGTGVTGTFPPLTGNPVVTGDATKVIHIVKYGLNGKVDVNGASYNGMMPAWGQQLSNADIAAVITYVRSAWGNKAGPVTEAQVAAVTQ